MRPIIILLFIFYFLPSLAAIPPREKIREKQWKVITVAVIDTGLDVKHPYFKDSLWENPGETGWDANQKDKSTNGVDDDGDGYIDDVHGWNFLENNGSIQDEHGHGTHISGLIASAGREIVLNAKLDAIATAADPHIKIMVLKNYGKRPDNNLQATLQALKFAIDHNVDLINFSGGGLEPSLDELQILRQAEMKKITLVAAAGNEGRSNDDFGFYPASYGLKNIIAVGSANSKGHRLPSSNFGSSVGLFIPGEQILSTLPMGKWGTMTGTSQAAARASGMIAHRLTQFEKNDMRESKNLN